MKFYARVIYTHRYALVLACKNFIYKYTHISKYTCLLISIQLHTCMNLKCCFLIFTRICKCSNKYNNLLFIYIFIYLLRHIPKMNLYYTHWNTKSLEHIQTNIDIDRKIHICVNVVNKNHT